MTGSSTFSGVKPDCQQVVGVLVSGICVSRQDNAIHNISIPEADCSTAISTPLF
jgi:hypothetical protein